MNIDEIMAVLKRAALSAKPGERYVKLNIEFQAGHKSLFQVDLVTGEIYDENGQELLLGEKL